MALLEPVVPEEQQHTACLLAISKTLDRWRVEDRHDGKPKGQARQTSRAPFEK